MEHSKGYIAELVVYATNRSGLLADISKSMSDSGIDIQALKSKINRQGTATMYITFAVAGRDEVNIIIGKLKNIDSVLDVKRNTEGE